MFERPITHVIVDGTPLVSPIIHEIDYYYIEGWGSGGTWKVLMPPAAMTLHLRHIADGVIVESSMRADWHSEIAVKSVARDTDGSERLTQTFNLINPIID